MHVRTGLSQQSRQACRLQGWAPQGMVLACLLMAGQSAEAVTTPVVIGNGGNGSDGYLIFASQ